MAEPEIDRYATQKFFGANSKKMVLKAYSADDQKVTVVVCETVNTCAKEVYTLTFTMDDLFNLAMRKMYQKAKGHWDESEDRKTRRTKRNR